LVDMKGDVVHQWQSERGISNPELLPSGNLICLGKPDPINAGQRGLNGQASCCVELDWDGNIVWSYEDPWMHHDYERLPNGNTLLVKWESLPRGLIRKVKGGYQHEKDDPKKMLGDAVLEVSPEGEIVRKWNSWEHLDPSTEIIGALDHRMEWTHCNSISYTPKGNWLLSFRRISLICEVNPKTEKIVWKWGDGTTAHQHDAKYSSKKTITLFDNGVHRKHNLDYSRVIEIDAKSKKILWEYSDDPPFSFYSYFGGSVDYLPNGNYLICETAKGQMFEVTRDKKVVWEYISPFYYGNPRLGGRMNATFRAHRYAVDFPGLHGKDLDPKRFGNLNRLLK